MTPAPAFDDDDDAEIRELELVLTHVGTAELIDYPDEGGEGVTVWSSDSDDDFREQFPDFLNEGDLEGVVDYLEDAGIVSANEAYDMEISMESLTAAAAKDGPGDDDDDDDDEEE